MTSTNGAVQKVLGVFGRNYLRETGFARMRQDVRLVMFSEADSALHRIADYSCPIPSLDSSPNDLIEEVRSAEGRGIAFDGFISFRDRNVLPAAMAANLIPKHRRPPRSAPLQILRTLQSKRATRLLLNQVLPKGVHTAVDCEFLDARITRNDFRRKLTRLLKRGPIILKPDAGSCSYYIKDIPTTDDLEPAWEHFKRASHFRGGSFVAEEQIKGQEFPVDTIASEDHFKAFLCEYLPREAGKFYEVGIITPARIDERAKMLVERLMFEIHKRLRLENIITHIEVILPPSGPPAVVEINPRLAGDLMQELYLNVYGVDFYRIAARIATGQSVPKEFLGGEGEYKYSLIRFHPPANGFLTLPESSTKYLCSKADKFGAIAEPSSLILCGDTNDDRPAYILLAGNNREELEVRSATALSTCIKVQPSRSKCLFASQ